MKKAQNSQYLDPTNWTHSNSTQMNKYIITSAFFQGEIEAVYIDKALAVLDFTQCRMSNAAKADFKAKLAVNEDALGGCFKAGTVEIIKGDVEITFEMFWNKYAKKRNPKRCRPLWDKLSKAKKVEAFLGIDRYDKFLKKETWRVKMDPENYLRDERWLDENE